MPGRQDPLRLRRNPDGADVRLSGELARSTTPAPGRHLPFLAVPIGAAAAAFLLFAAVLIGRDDRLLTQAYDQAFFEQVVWNAGHAGRFASGFTAGNFLGLHFEPLLIVPAILELAWPDARLLTFLNALGLAATPVAGFLLARALLPGRPWLAAALAAPVPAWSVVQQAAIAQFHPEALALPAALLAAWAGVSRRTALMWFFALLALAAKEDQAYTVMVVGLLVAATGRRRTGLVLAGVAIGWGLVVIGVVMPLLRAGIRSDVAGYYDWLPAAGPGAIAAALVHPAGWLAFAGLLVAMGGLPLLRPGWLGLALPPLIADLLSAHAGQADLRFHYGLLLAVPLFIAGVQGARALPPLPGAWGLAFAVPALVVGILVTPFVPPAEPLALTRLRECTASLPALAPVAADDPTAAPLAARPVLKPTALADPTMYVVIDRVGHEPSYVDRAGRAEVISDLPDTGRRLLCDDGRFQLWSPAGG